MHPIERLRFVAGVGSGRPDLLAREAAAALMGCDELAELVVACRRLLDRHPATGPLWWVASRALTAPDPHLALRDAIEQLDADPTLDHLDDALGVADDHAIVEAWALGPGGLLGDPDAIDAAYDALARGRPVWAVAGVGRILPARIWEAVGRRSEAWLEQGRVGRMDAGDVSLVVAPIGLVPWADALTAIDCPVAPELLHGGARRR